jgi:hypothetical protein
MSAYWRAIVAANLSTTPSPHSEEALFPRLREPLSRRLILQSDHLPGCFEAVAGAS